MADNQISILPSIPESDGESEPDKHSVGRLPDMIMAFVHLCWSMNFCIHLQSASQFSGNFDPVVCLILVFLVFCVSLCIV